MNKVSLMPSNEAKLFDKTVDRNLLILVIQNEETHIQMPGNVVCYDCRLSRKFYYNPGRLRNDQARKIVEYYDASNERANTSPSRNLFPLLYF